jgi:hypothetical protein
MRHVAMWNGWFLQGGEGIVRINGAGTQRI